MNVLLETAFDRLLSKYERTFGEQPPFTAATAEEVIGYMRRRLREAARAEQVSGRPPGCLSAVERSTGAAPVSLQR